MKIFINAVNLKVGGGVTVLTSFLKEIIQDSQFHKDKFHVLVPDGVGYEKYNIYPITIEIAPKKMMSPLLRILLDHTWLKNRIKQVGPDIIFSMGNIAVPSNFPQAVLFHFPYAMYPEDNDVWSRLPLLRQLDFRMRNLIFSSRLKYADIVFPQTKSAGDRLVKYYTNKIKKIQVIPNATYKLVSKINQEVFFDRLENYKYLLCLTRYYSHKNVEIFIPLAKLIKVKQSPIKIITTIEDSQGDGGQLFLAEIKKYELQDIIINIGKIPMDSVPALYSKVDGLILPTLLESFSATYIDSMTLGVPVFTSDRDFAHDVCGSAAYYFDPLNEEHILDVVSRAFGSEREILQKINYGKVRSSEMPDWHGVTKLYLDSLRALSASHGQVGLKTNE